MLFDDFQKNMWLHLLCGRLSPANNRFLTTAHTSEVLLNISVRRSQSGTKINLNIFTSFLHPTKESALKFTSRPRTSSSSFYHAQQLLLSWISFHS